MELGLEAPHTAVVPLLPPRPPCTRPPRPSPTLPNTCAPPPSPRVRAHARPVPPLYCVLRLGTPVQSSLAAASPPRAKPALCLPPVRCHAHSPPPSSVSALRTRPAPPRPCAPAPHVCIAIPVLLRPLHVPVCLGTLAVPPCPSRLASTPPSPSTAATPAPCCLPARAPLRLSRPASTLPPRRVPAHATPVPPPTSPRARVPSAYHHAAFPSIGASHPRPHPDPHPSLTSFPSLL
ncbi:hypothetical protein B0H14DRAFT_3533632 [Mycena olivaceomarginata]|nr:hypothetical protein B0H14DRAFT_3533632 [Mycena olivaceomarginata]